MRITYIKILTICLFCTMMISACREVSTEKNAEEPNVMAIEDVTEAPVVAEEEPKITTAPAVLLEIQEDSFEEEIGYLNFEETISFEVDNTKEIDKYHDAITVIEVEDEQLIERLFTLPELEPVRNYLETYACNTEPGQIGLISSPDSLYVLCNKLNKLSSDYVPEDLVEPSVAFSFDTQDMKRNMRKNAAGALEEMFEAAEEHGLKIVAVSGYRSYDRQDTIYSYNVQTRGVEETDKVSARPGHSEHQTGLAMDVSSAGANYSLKEVFGETPEGIWINDNAHRFGFIVRYEEHRVSNTGYSYEPWHLRYVGLDLAKVMYENDLTLEMVYTTLQRKP